MRVKTALLKPNPYNRSVSDDALDDLIRSVQENGVLEPLLYRKSDYRIIDGERRWRAAKKLNLPTVPAYSKECSDLEIKLAILNGSIHKQLCDPIFEGELLSTILKEEKLTQEQLAKRLGKSQDWVSNRVSLVRQLAPEAKKRGRSLDFTLLRELSRLKDKRKQVEFLEKIQREGLTSRQLQALVEHANEIDDVLHRITDTDLREQMQREVERPSIAPAILTHKIEIVQKLEECQRSQEELPLALDAVYTMDCRELLAKLPDESIDCVVTSPPYWQLRDYGVPAQLQLGLEETFEKYLTKLCDIFDEVQRVLKAAGTCWVNMGDTYGTGSGAGIRNGKQATNRGTQEFERRQKEGKEGVRGYEKCLLQIPSRFAIEMCNRGWILRNEIIWHKPNCMPSSAKDRFTVDFEKLFFFVKSPHYYFEQQHEPHTSNEYDLKRMQNGRKTYDGKWSEATVKGWNATRLQKSFVAGAAEGRNKRCVWRIPTKSCPDAHFATYPPELVEIPIQAGCPQFICALCGKARERIYEGKSQNAFNIGARDAKAGRFHQKWGSTQNPRPFSEQYEGDKAFAGDGRRFLGYTDCGCNAPFEPGIVLDPFAGSGTTLVVARELSRRYLGCDVNPEYVELARRRLSGTTSVGQNSNTPSSSLK